MKHEIIWSKDAGDELVDIISYKKYNTGNITAKKINDKIMNEVERISENPEGRRRASGFTPLLREFGINHIHQFNISPWIIYYKLENNKMEIISIIDGRRNLEEILYKKIIDGKIV